MSRIGGRGGVAGPLAAIRVPFASLAVRLGVTLRELAGVAAIFGLGAALRLVNLPVRGGWDSDQGTEMLGLRAALESGRLPTFGPEAISVSSSFHHGALYYDLLLPAAWLGNGDPTWVVAEIALLSLIVIPIVWWLARSIGGPAAGLAAALLAAVSAALVSYATFIWNPTLVEPGAAIAYLGAWQAIRTRRPGWWAVAAIGGAVAVQAHIAAGIIALPLGLTFAFDLWRAGEAGPSRRRVAAWGAVGVAFFVLTYTPLIVSELGSDFADTRGMLAYFSEPNSATSTALPLRVLFAAIRIVAWPLTRWPIVDFNPAFGLAFLVAATLMIGLVWRLGVTARPRRPVSSDAAVDATVQVAAGPDVERTGTRFVGLCLLLVIVGLGIGLHAVSEVQELPTEQYHVVADPLVFVAAGLILGGLWRAIPMRRVTIARRVVAVAAVALLLAWNAGHWPPLTSPDGGWPAAQAAAARVERDAAGSSIALVPLYEPKGADAYLYPLTLDGFTPAASDAAGVVVLLCDTFWLEGCGGAAETGWLASNGLTASLTQIDRFPAAPDRILTVYRRSP